MVAILNAVEVEQGAHKLVDDYSVDVDVAAHWAGDDCLLANVASVETSGHQRRRLVHIGNFHPEALHGLALTAHTTRSGQVVGQQLVGDIQVAEDIDYTIFQFG